MVLKFSGDFFNTDNTPYSTIYTLWLHRKEGGVLEEDKIRTKATFCCPVTGTSSSDRSTCGVVKWDSDYFDF